MRRMSFYATRSQMYRKTKTVTRRGVDTWTNLEPGHLLMAVEKAQGLKAGERQKCIHPIEVTAVEVQFFHTGLTPEEVAAEGFPGMTPEEFIASVWEPLNGRVRGMEKVRRIEFKHRADMWTPGYRPSNGTDGEYFRARWCGNCSHDHAIHLDPENGGYPDHPEGVCSIFTRSLIESSPGPTEWERRTVPSDAATLGYTWDTRCTAFEDCGGCETLRAEAKAKATAKAWPVESPDAWKPRTVAEVTGQAALFS